jgi:organic hydroperoxide reductase OsmC/OhrA
MDRARAEELMKLADAACPYSKAARGNLPVELVVEG